MRTEKGLIGWIILIVLAAITITVVLLIMQAPKSLPGDFIYPIKEIQENIKIEQSGLNFTFTIKADAYLDLTQERLTELERLIKRGNKDKEVIITVQRLLDTQAKAVNNMKRARDQRENLQAQFAKFDPILRTEQNDLPKLIYNVPQPTRESLQKAINQSYSDSQLLESIRR